VKLEHVYIISLIRFEELRSVQITILRLSQIATVELDYYCV